MKLGDLFTKVINTKNKQINLTVKKKLVRTCGYNDIDELLNLKLSKKIKDNLYRQ